MKKLLAGNFHCSKTKKKKEKNTQKPFLFDSTKELYSLVHNFSDGKKKLKPTGAIPKPCFSDLKRKPHNKSQNFTFEHFQKRQITVIARVFIECYC